MEPEYLKFPTKDEFRTISNEFYEKWNFPNCVGAMDGKHVRIQAPKNSGSEYYNYKNYFSVVLFAICDANYKFTYVDIGGYGSDSDSGMYSSSHIGAALNEGMIDLPEPEPLPNLRESAFKYPFQFVGDEAFPLKPYLARPYGGRTLNVERRIFNYRLSWARRVIENTFGIFVSKWRVFRQSINLKPSTVTIVIKAACCLHNYLIQCDSSTGMPAYVTSDSVDSGDVSNGSWRSDTSNLANFTNINSGLALNHPSENAIRIRDYLCKYFSSSAGSVSWQHKHI